MATAELAVSPTRGGRRPLRFFFMFMVAASFAILSLAFVPEFIA
jgi:hypothetical protein